MSENDIWHGDQLNRQEQAELFTRVINKEYAFQLRANKQDSPAPQAGDSGHNLIINIDADYGLGKTFFVHRWAKMVVARSHLAIVFDAWRNDYTQEPLEALLVEILNQIEKQLDQNNSQKSTHLSEDSAFKHFKNLAPKLLKSVVPIGVNIATLAILGTPIFQGKMADWLPELTETLASAAINHHREREDCIIQFKKALRTLIIETEKSKHALPIYIFIDELDRCRPTYAIELLERVKHIFDIEGLCFVFCTTTSQLAASIRSVYGSDFAAEDYLRRFFSYTYALAEPDYKKFAEHLFANRGNLTDIIKNRNVRVFYGDDIKYQDEIDREVIKAFIAVSEGFNLTLRDQEQLHNAFKIFVETLLIQELKAIHLHFALILLAIKLFKPNQYHQLKTKGDINWKEAADKKNSRFVETFGTKDSEIDLKFKDDSVSGKIKKITYKKNLEAILYDCKIAERLEIKEIDKLAQPEDEIRDNNAYKTAMFRCLLTEITDSRGSTHQTLGDLESNPFEATRRIIDTLIYKPN